MSGLVAYNVCQVVSATNFGLVSAVYSTNSVQDRYDQESLIDYSLPDNRLYQNASGEICLAEMPVGQKALEIASKKITQTVHSISNIVKKAFSFLLDMSEGIKKIIPPFSTKLWTEKMSPKEERRAALKRLKQEQRANDKKSMLQALKNAQYEYEWAKRAYDKAFKNVMNIEMVYYKLKKFSFDIYEMKERAHERQDRAYDRFMSISAYLTQLQEKVSRL